MTVDVRGVDVDDPTTGPIRGHSTDEIACWFIDTNLTVDDVVVALALRTSDDQRRRRTRQTV